MLMPMGCQPLAPSYRDSIAQTWFLLGGFQADGTMNATLPGVEAESPRYYYLQ